MTVGTPASRRSRPSTKPGTPGGPSYGPSGNMPGRKPGPPANQPWRPGGGASGSGKPGRTPGIPGGAYGAAIAFGIVGGAVAYWWAKAYGNMPGMLPGKAVAMDFDVGTPPYSDEKYRTDLVPRTVTAPQSAPIMAYDTFRRWHPSTGAPRAYWAQTYLIPEASRVLAPAPLIYPQPDPNDEPTHSPIRLPKPQPMPFPDMFPGHRPQPSPRPGPRPRPNPVTPPVGSIGFDVGPNGVTRINPRGKPPRGVRERKSRALGAAHVFWEAFNFGTEFMDFVDSVLIGFGIKPQGWKWNIETLLDILENPDGYAFDMGAFVEALAFNHVEDWVIGNASRKLTESLQSLGVSVYGGITPGGGFI